MADMGTFIERRDLVALKLHFGEKGNTGCICPQFLRRIVTAKVTSMINSGRCTLI